MRTNREKQFPSNDDGEKHVPTVDESIARLGIPRPCLRFSRADAKVKAFPQEAE